jgi:hypothetical protein
VDQRDKRAREIRDSICEVLARDWDPIEVKDTPEARDEYDRYIGDVYRLLSTGEESAMATHLASVERDAMGFSTSAEALLPLAGRLRQLAVRLENTQSPTDLLTTSSERA